MAGARVLHWNGRDIPEELRELPNIRPVIAGRRVIVFYDGNAPARNAACCLRIDGQEFTLDYVPAESTTPSSSSSRKSREPSRFFARRSFRTWRNSRPLGSWPVNRAMRVRDPGR